VAAPSKYASYARLILACKLAIVASYPAMDAMSIARFHAKRV
jgi:hypothetical protein